MRTSKSAAVHPSPAHGRADSADLRDAFQRLPLDRRTLLVLHHLHGYGVKEIGAWLGVPTGTVKWRLSRARRALRAELERDR